MPRTESAEVDLIAVDLAVVSRARLVMQQLLLRCVVDPLDSSALQAAYEVQLMLAEDIDAAAARLEAALSCG